MSVYGIEVRPGHAAWFQRFLDTNPINTNKFQFLKYVRDKDAEVFEAFAIKHITTIEDFVLLCTTIPTIDVVDFDNIGKCIKDFDKTIKEWANVVAKICTVDVIRHVLVTYNNCMATIIDILATERLLDLPKVLSGRKIDDVKSCGCHIFTKLEKKALPHLAANGVYTVVADSLHADASDFSLLKPYVNYLKDSYLTALSNDLLVYLFRYLYITNCKTASKVSDPETDFMNMLAAGFASLLQNAGDTQ